MTTYLAALSALAPHIAAIAAICLALAWHESRDRSRAQVAAERVATRERLVRCEANENANWRN